MTRISTKFTATLLVTTAISTPAFAQVATAPPPLYTTVDDFGVDLLSGDFRFAMNEGTIGSGEGAVSLQRFRGDSGYRDNWSNGLYLSSGGPLYVEFGNYSDSFVASGGSYVSQKANGATLVTSGTGYLYTAADGTKIQYATRGGNNLLPLQGFACVEGVAVGQCAIPMSVTKPDGLVFTINWAFADITTRSTAPRAHHSTASPESRARPATASR